MQNKRQILWVYDEEGGKGKTYMANVLQFIFSYAVLDGVTKTCDVAMLLSQGEDKGVCFDVTRSDAAYFSYQTLEAVKNERLVSGKYQGQITLLDDVPVVVFANFQPLYGKLSDDRVELLSLCEEEAVAEGEEAATEIGTVSLEEVPLEKVAFA